MEGYINDLINPNLYTENLELGNYPSGQLVEFYEKLFLIRRAEEYIGEQIIAGKIVCPCHLAIGQEAIAVGVSSALTKYDRVFGAHRSHAHYLALGGTVHELFAEVLGKVTGCSKGMGGSMHLFDQKNGFYGSVPIVAGTVSLSVGAALAAKFQKNNDIAVSYFGDGAAEEGIVHESLNLARNYQLPVLFVCENNLFSSHLHINQRQPQAHLARFAKAHDMPYAIVDGNDVIAVADATHNLVNDMRAGHGPAFLETFTYRWRGHVGPSEDIDVGVARNQDLQLWKKRDPIRRLRESLLEKQILKNADLDHIHDRVEHAIITSWQRAEADPYPEESALLDLVYKQEEAQ